MRKLVGPALSILALSTLALATLALLAVLAVPASAASFQPDAEQGFLDAINASRTDAGLGVVTVNAELAGIAREWTALMDADDELKHNPSYAEQYSGEWSRMGENVGYATRDADNTEMVAVLHEAFMNSSGHRDNILGDYNQVGIGVVRDGHTLWVTVNFLQGPVRAEDQTARPDAAGSSSTDESEQVEAERDPAPGYVPPPSERRWGSR